jgi:pentatricopeptide repeat protein
MLWRASTYGPYLKRRSFIPHISWHLRLTCRPFALNAAHVATTPTLTRDDEQLPRAISSKLYQTHVGHTRKERNTSANQGGEGSDPEMPPELLSILNGSAAHRVIHNSRARDLILQHLPTSKHVRLCVEEMAASSQPSRAYHLLVLAYESGITLKHSAYHGAVYQLARTQCWRLVPPLVALASRQLGHTTPRLLDWLLRAHIETSYFSQLDQVFATFEREHMRVSRRTFHLVVAGHLRNHDLASARGYLQRMEEAGYPVDSSTHALILGVYRVLGPDKEVGRRAFQALQDIGGRSATHTLNNLMQICLDGHDLPGALDILRLFRSGLEPSTPSPSPSIHGALEDLRPDPATYTMLLNYMARTNDLPRAMQVVEQAHHTGLAPDTGFIAALVRVHFRTQDASLAIAIVGRVCQDTVPYSRFMDLGAATSPRHLPIPSWSSLRPDVLILNELADGLLRSKGLSGFLATMRIMRACGVQPDESTLDIFLSHLRTTERIRPRELFRILQTLRRIGLRPTMKQYHGVLSTIVREERLLVRPGGWGRRLTEPPRLNLASRNSPISKTSTRFHPGGGFQFPTRLRYRRMAEPLLQSLSSRGLRADRATIALRIKHDATVKGDVDQARSLFANMAVAGMHPSVYHYCALMEGYAAARDMPAAVDALKSAQSAGLKPNVVMYTVLITGYARTGQPEKALRAFEEMLESGIRPDHASVDALCSAYFAAGDLVLTRQLLLRLWPHVADMSHVDYQDMSLKKLREAFRMTAGHRSAVTRTQSQPRQRRMLRWKIRRILDAWVPGRSPLRTRSRRPDTKSPPVP